MAYVYTENGTSDIGSGASSGEVGIGTSSTDTLLTIKPSSNVAALKIEEDGSTEGWKFHVDTANNDNLEIIRYNGTTDTDILKITTGGGLGVGVPNAPSGVLHLYDDTSRTTALIQNAGNPGDPVLQFQIAAKTISMGIDDSDSDKFKIGTTQIENGTLLTIDGNGDVGIGTTDPVDVLHVLSSNASGGIRIDNNATDGDPTLEFVLDGAASPTFTFGIDDSDSDKFKIGTTAVETNTRLTIDSSGNVGIGTDTPGEKLEVNGRIKDETGYVMPVGSILPYGGSSAPTGWLLCDGSSKSRSTYADLFTAIGTTFGSVDGSSFNVPDFKRRVPVGAGGTGTSTLGNSVGDNGGAETHTLTTAELASHSHVYHTRENASAGNTARTMLASESGNAVDNVSTQPNGSDVAHNNMQPSLVVNTIIKT